MDEWPFKFDKAHESNWAHVLEICDRDARESRFHLIAQVAVLFFLQKFYEVLPSDLGVHFQKTALVTVFLIGAVGASLTYAFAHSRGRAIRFMLSGTTTALAANGFLAQSRIVSVLIATGFIISAVALAVGIALVFLLNV